MPQRTATNAASGPHGGSRWSLRKKWRFGTASHSRGRVAAWGRSQSAIQATSATYSFRSCTREERMCTSSTTHRGRRRHTSCAGTRRGTPSSSTPTAGSSTTGRNHSTSTNWSSLLDSPTPLNGRPRIRPSTGSSCPPLAGAPAPSVPRPGFARPRRESANRAERPRSTTCFR